MQSALKEKYISIYLVIMYKKCKAWFGACTSGVWGFDSHLCLVFVEIACSIHDSQVSSLFQTLVVG